MPRCTPHLLPPGSLSGMALPAHWRPPDLAPGPALAPARVLAHPLAPCSSWEPALHVRATRPWRQRPLALPCVHAAWRPTLGSRGILWAPPRRPWRTDTPPWAAHSPAPTWHRSPTCDWPPGSSLPSLSLHLLSQQICLRPLLPLHLDCPLLPPPPVVTFFHRRSL